MRTFSTSAELVKPFEEFLQSALVVLTSNGFIIEWCDRMAAEVTGPGLRSTRQNPLLGATRIRIERSGERVELSAELGGVEGMRR